MQRLGNHSNSLEGQLRSNTKRVQRPSRHIRNQCIVVCQFEFITNVLMKNIIQTKHILCLLDFVDKCNGSKAILACNAIDIVLEKGQGKQMSYSIAHLHLHAFSP